LLFIKFERKTAAWQTPTYRH